MMFDKLSSFQLLIIKQYVESRQYKNTYLLHTALCFMIRNRSKYGRFLHVKALDTE